MIDESRSITIEGITMILPGHEAGKAQVRRYLGMLGHIMKGMMIAALVLTVLASFMIAARGMLGLDLMPTRFTTRLAAIDAMETAAMLLGVALALTTGVPMGVYVLGLMAGYDDIPFED